MNAMMFWVGVAWAVLVLVPQPAAICKRPKGFITRLQRFRALGPLPRVAFCGDYLSNSTVGQAHWTGLQAADELHAR